MRSPSHERWRIQPPTIGAGCGVIAVVLLVGFLLLSEKGVPGEALPRTIYRAGQLMSLNQAEPDPAEHPRQAERIAIVVAQVLAVVAVAMLGFEFFRLLGGRGYERLRVMIRRASPGVRVMVIGDGPAATSVVDGLFDAAGARDRRVLVTMVRSSRDDDSIVQPSVPS